MDPAAAAPARQFDIPQQPYRDGLIAFALQANLSLLGAENCGDGSSPQIRGRFEPEAALRTLLADAPCHFRFVAPAAVGILPGREPKAVPIEQIAPVSELLVTARKHAEPVETIGGAISIVGRDAIEGTLAGDTGDVIGLTTGLSMTNLGPARDKLIARGLSDGVFTGRARSTVGTYLDDVPLNYDVPDPDLRLNDVERIEVLRGPQGALYGAGALTGVYRIVTRKPDLMTPNYGGDLRLASTQAGGNSHVYEGHVGLPLILGRLAIRLSAYHDVRGGYLDNVSLRRSNVDRTLRDGARLAVRFQPVADWTFDLSGAGQSLKTNDTQYVGAVSRRARRSNKVAESHENLLTAWSLAAKGKLRGADVSANVALVRHKFDSLYDASAALSLFDVHDAQLGVYEEGRGVRMAVGDMVLTSQGGGRWTWLAGLYGADILERSPGSLSVTRRARQVTIYLENRRDRIREAAAYGQLGYDLGSGWWLSAGGRWYATHSAARDAIAGTRAVSQASASEAFSGFAPMLSLQRSLRPGVLAYALYSRGYRPAGFDFTLPHRFAHGRNFAPDYLDNYEFGSRFKTLGGRLSGQAALFFDRWSNIQTDQYYPSGLAYTTNIGDAHLSGLEVQLTYNPAPQLTLAANASLIASELDRLNRGAKAVAGRQLPGAPKAQGGVTIMYHRPLVGSLTADGVVQLSYVGRSQLNFDRGSPAMGGYVQSQVSAGVSGRGWTARAFVRNPFNAVGDTFAYGNPFSFGQVRQVTPLRPRTAGVALSAGF